MSSSRSFLFYCCVFLVTAGSVAFSLDWTSAPLPPMPETEATVQAAKLAAHVPPPGAFKAVAQVRSVYPARPLPPGAAPAVTAMAEPADCPAGARGPGCSGRAGAAEMRYRGLQRRLSFVPRGGLFVAAVRRPAPLLRQGRAAADRSLRRAGRCWADSGARAGRRAIAAQLSRRGVQAGLLHVQSGRLHLSALERAEEAVHEVNGV